MWRKPQQGEKVMRIQHNIAALNSYRNLGVNNSGVAKNLEKLSSGYRINRAGDDAAGLAISEKMRSQITGLNTATKNANDGISLVQTAEGALTEVHSMLNRMVEIATQSSNGVYEDGVDREALQDEMDALTEEIDRIAEGTNFNKRNLLNGDFAKTIEASKTVADTNAPTGELTVSLGSKFQDKGLTINFAHGDSDVLNATIANDGTITVTADFNAGKGDLTFTGAEIQKVIQDAVNSKDTAVNKLAEGTLTKEEQNEFKDAVNGMVITGGLTRKGNGASVGKYSIEAAIQDDGYAEKGTGMNLQIGDTNADFNKLNVAIKNMHAQNLGLKGISVAKEDEAGDAVDVINHAINIVSTQRGKLGAIQNRLEHTINNLSVNAENMTAAESRIRDVDMADEMMKYTKNNILVQASQAMLAQANQVPQGVLQLLQ